MRSAASYDWPDLERQLDAQGQALAGGLLRPEECRALAALFAQDSAFRSHVNMAAHGFGSGVYKYFAYPLPGLVQALRAEFYPQLAAIANGWQEALGAAARFPAELDAFLERCHRGGQRQPTPLLLEYDPGDYNCLHQDVYGEHVFPLQLAILLAAPGVDFTGGEFVMTEQRPRMQSRATVVPLQQGDGVIFAVRERPVRGARGAYRVQMRHGVSALHSGRRHTLGILFHDAA